MAHHQDLARIAVETRLQDIGAQTRAALDAVLIDTIGCAMAAAPEAFSQNAIKAAQATHGGGLCSVIGRSERLTPSARIWKTSPLYWLKNSSVNRIRWANAR